MSCASLLVGCGVDVGPLDPALAQEDLERPEVVAAWLKANAASANRKREEAFIQMAKDAARQRNWGAAAKGFGQSAMHFPTPQALRGYADASLRVYGPVRARTGETFREKSDLAGAQRVLDTAAAADAVLNELSPADKRALEQDRACLQSYLEDNLAPADAARCAPIAAYRDTDR